MREGIDHEVFVIPGIVDGQVVLDQADRKLQRSGETTHIHYHKEGVLCNMKCRIIMKEESNEDPS